MASKTKWRGRPSLEAQSGPIKTQLNTYSWHKTIAKQRIHLDKYKAWASIDPHSLSMMINFFVFEMLRCALASFLLLLNFVKLGILHSRLSWAVTQWLLCPIWRTRRRRGCELELNKFEVHGCDLFPHDDCLLKMQKKIVYWLPQKYNAIICSDTPTMWLWRNWTCVH